ncbi:hypothetical protein H2140_004324 [Escherichia coli]|nr:hypothetical protein [Escherichia coli]EFX4649960.1 hypothetical protein [Shigella sonnei]EFY5665965.1 hypothetical protein [Shigella sonnei]
MSHPPVKPTLQLTFPNINIARNLIKQGYPMLLHFATLNFANRALQWVASPPLDPAKIKTVLQGDGSLCEPSPSTSLVGHFEHQG